MNGHPAEGLFRLRYHNTEVVLPLGTFVPGRGVDCDLLVSDPLASRRHAVLHVSERRVVLEDPGSRNGVFLNEERMRGRRVVKHGDRIGIGAEVLLLLEGRDLVFPPDNPTRPSKPACPEDETRIQSPMLSLLSPREREVLELVARGHTSKEIGERLCISPKTVESHRARLSVKLRLESRAELVRFAIDHGLLPAPPREQST